ncbi:MAG: XdhC family protein, partial [Gemmatimonadales bacterium]
AIAWAVHAAGFRVVVVDDRPEFADPARFPPQVTVCAAPVHDALQQVPITPADAIVIATRGHRHDAVILERVATSPASYVGLLGSRRKKAVVTKALAAAGVPADALERVRVPVGVPIGAVTPEEIAVSVVAELIAWRRNALTAP